MIKRPSFSKTLAHLKKRDKLDPIRVLHEFGKRGVAALSAATPVDTGETAMSWSYKIEGDRNRYRLIWTNSVMAGGAPLVLLLQYGHATKSGYYLSGRDFINPALRPVYDALERALRKEASI